MFIEWQINLLSPQPLQSFFMLQKICLYNRTSVLEYSHIQQVDPKIYVPNKKQQFQILSSQRGKPAITCTLAQAEICSRIVSLLQPPLGDLNLLLVFMGQSASQVSTQLISFIPHPPVLSLPTTVVQNLSVMKGC